MSGKPDLENYVEVHERIEKFYEKHPEGSLQGHFHGLREVNGETFLVYSARAYRSPEDERPGVGWSWEPVPGKTNFTRDSELENAETSAWGRALAALGFEVHRGIASANEVRARGGGSNAPTKSEPPSAKQKGFILGQGNRQGLFDKAMLNDGSRKAIIRYTCGGDELTKQGASAIISALKDDPEKGAEELLAGIEQARANGDENAQQALSLLTDDVPIDLEGVA